MNNLPTKRRVEITVGVPDILDGVEGTKNKDMAHPDECYFLTFVDALEEDGCHNTLSAQTTCLCQLQAATVAWLQGATEEEVQAVLAGGHDEDEEHGEDWKKS